MTMTMRLTSVAACLDAAAQRRAKARTDGAR
jgi:hypothetical protein